MKTTIKTLSLLATAALLSPVTHLSAVTTDPVGYVTAEIAAGNVPYAPPMVKAASYSGTIASIVEDAEAGTSVVSLDSASFDSGAYDADDYPKYYLEVVEEGDLQGYVFDVITSDTDSVTIDGLVSSDFLIPSGSSVVVREHLTVADLFADSDDITAYSDSLKFFNDDGSTTTLFWDGSMWTSDSFTSASNRPIYPGGGFICAFGQPITITVAGSVKTTATKIPLYAGVNNFVASLSPSGTTLGDLNLVDTLVAYSDSLKMFSETGDLSSAGIYFSDGTMVTDFNADASDVTVGAVSSYIISVGSDSYWTVPAAYTD
jgi:hypothetical protein